MGGVGITRYSMINNVIISSSNSLIGSFERKDG